MCTQCEETSFRWFKLGCRRKISNFSSKQSGQYFLSGVIGVTLFAISHSILWPMLFSNFQICSLNPVADFLCSSLKDDLSRLCLVFNVFSVSPMYISFAVRFGLCYGCFVDDAFCEAFRVYISIIKGNFGFFLSYPLNVQ